MTKIFALVTVVAGVILAGCGSGETTVEPGKGDTTTTTPTKTGGGAMAAPQKGLD